MSKNHTIEHSFDITSDEAFNSLADAFSSVIGAVEAQGYGTEYNGEMLYHPGQIGVIGKSGTGKSTFINRAVDGALSDASVEEKLHPSHDKSRLVQVWKQWTSDDGARQIQSKDVMASSSLMHLGMSMRPPERTQAGVTFFEHALDMEDMCDMVLRFRYDEDGGRFLDLKTTEDVASSAAFTDDFLPNANALG